jgi:hypothetical protein
MAGAEHDIVAGQVGLDASEEAVERDADLLHRPQ